MAPSGQLLRHASLGRRWLYTLNLFFVIYSAVMLGIYLLGPDSGRLSTLVCKPNARGKSVCTVKIFGIRKIYRQDFYAYNYVETLISNNVSYHPPPYYNEMALPWGSITQYDYLYNKSSVCAVSIRTSPQLIDFVPPYQSTSNCEQVEAMITRAFAGDWNKIDIQFNGYNPFIYVLASMIIFGSLVLVGQSTPGIIRWIKNHKASRAIDNQGVPAQSGAISPRPEVTKVGGVEQIKPLISKVFILTWWAAAALMLLFVIGFFFLRSKGNVEGETYGCFISIRDYQGILLRPFLRNLVAILPLVSLATMLAMLQWQALQSYIQVSRWWIAAPVLAGILLFFGLPANLHCMDVDQLSFPIYLPFYDTVGTWVLMGLYFLLVGLGQWLVLRKSLRFSLGWIIAPLLAAGTPGILFLPLAMLFIASLIQFNLWVRDIFFWPYTIIASLIMFFVVTSFNFLAGFYLYRLIRTKYKTLQTARDPGSNAEILDRQQPF